MVAAVRSVEDKNRARGKLSGDVLVQLLYINVPFQMLIDW